MNKKRFMEKPKHQMLKPEEVFLGEEYAITINPSIQPCIGKCNSFKEWYNIFEHVFRDVCVASKFKLYVEISAMGRFHFHGTIIITNIMNFYMFDVKTLTQDKTCVIKNMDEAWEDYYLKQQDFIQPFLKRELYGPLVEPSEPLIRIDTQH